MKTTVNIFRTLLLAVLTLTFGACGEDSLLSELGLDGQTATKTDGAGEVWDGEADTSWYQADATEFQIATAEQLAGLARLVNAGYTFEGKTIKLTADILLNDISDWENWGSTAPAHTWTPIGSDANRFTGTLDGDGHSVSGIYINSEADNQGLVGVLGSGGALQNLGVKASYIKGGNDVGGVCGQNYATMTNCYNTGKVTGSYFVGGLCGMNYGTVNNCYNTGSVAGSSRVGGLCGRNDGTVSNCYNIGSVAGNDRVGGVCGYNYYATVTNCYNTGNVTGTGDYVGGVCGENYTTVTNCYNTGSVEGTNRVGGVCGYNYSATVTNCYNTGNVTGNNLVGGVCGYNYSATVTNCYNNGNVAGNYNAGGVCGYNEGTVSNCYYLNTCGAAGVGTSKTADEFASGEVAWLLQNEQAEQVWGQNLTLDPKDTYPVLGGLKVVQNGDGYANELKQDGDFYLISTADELRLFASMVNGGQTSIRAKLTADIELNNTTGWENWSESNAPANSWIPIGSITYRFSGTLDGDGHSVSGIYINSEADNQGLVGYLGSGGALQNLGVKASYIKGVNHVGGLCGKNMMGTVTNCYNSGNVAGTGDYVGGLCGMNEFGTVTNCYNTGSVTGNGNAGGLCGLNYMGTVTNCYYLDTCGAAGEGTSKTAKQFQSGEVASLLGEGWGQTIGTDDYPVLTTDANKKVYAYTMYQGQSKETGYANNNGNVDLDLTSHPNTIAVFEASGTFSGKNIVVKDGGSYTCAELVLTDDADFYTPVKFTATKATYTRSPKVWATNNGSGSGWETLCLPFSGTLYAGEEAKKPVDVASNNGAYWLRSLTGFETPNTLIFASPATAADSQIEAGMPYIIALPGTSFGSESLEGQTISVRGTNVTVTNEAQPVAAGSMFAFTGTFATKACDAASYRLNSENGTSGAGNLFVLDTQKTVLAPFRCCIDVTGFNIDGASTRSASGLPKELRIGQ